MSTCYLFAEHLNDENGLSLRLDANGQSDASLQWRTINELRQLQINSHTVVVLPTAWCGFYEVELPWINERKARAAIPFAIEEQLAQPVAELHFAFDRQHYQNGRYLIVVVEKQIMHDLRVKLDKLHLSYDNVTVDWFALQSHQACIVENNLLIHDATFKGALGAELLDNYLSNQTNYEYILKFNDSMSLHHSEHFTQVNATSYSWIAEQLFKNKPLNLCKGEFQHNTRQTEIKRWYKWAGISAIAWLVSVLILNSVVLLFLKHHLVDYDQRIAALYRQFFPEAHQVISPRFRIEQLLKNNQTAQNSILWNLLNQLSVASSTKIQIQQLRFQNKMLMVTLACPDFATLEAMEAKLQQTSIKVHQTEAATQDNRVIATLELS